MPGLRRKRAKFCGIGAEVLVSADEQPRSRVEGVVAARLPRDSAAMKDSYLASPLRSTGLQLAGVGETVSREL